MFQKDKVCACQVMDPSKREMFLFKSDLNKAKKKRRELHSLRCDLAYKLHVSCLTVLCCQCSAVQSRH